MPRRHRAPPRRSPTRGTGNLVALASPPGDGRPAMAGRLLWPSRWPWRLLLMLALLLPVVVDSQSIFSSHSSLQTAVNLWTSNEAAARSQYGEIGTWDVSRVTDMNTIFVDKETFNADINDWDVSRVTNMVSVLHISRNAHPSDTLLTPV